MTTQQEREIQEMLANLQKLQHEQALAQAVLAKRATRPADIERRQQTSLDAFIVNDVIDLVQVVKSDNQAAIDAARQVWGSGQVDQAFEMAKIPVTQETYDRSTPTVQRNLRVAKEVTIEKYNQIPAADRWKYTIKPKEVSSEVISRLGPAGRKYAVHKLSTFESITPWQEEKGEKATTRRVLAWEGQLVKNMVPGIYAGDWGKMSMPEKILNVSLDLLIIGSIAKPLVRGGAKALKPSIRVSKEAKLLFKDAAKSGVKDADLRIAVKRLEGSRGSMKELLKADEQKLAEKVLIASNVSRRADTALMNRLSSVQSLTTADLKKIQKLSKIPGLKKAVRDVQKHQDQLGKKWAALARWQKAHNFTPGQKMNLAEEAVLGKWFLYRKMLTSIQETKTKLDKALVRYGETVKPRVKDTPAPEFKGYQMQWVEKKRFGGKDDPLDDFDRLLKDSSDYIASYRRAETLADKERALYTWPGKTSAAVAEQPAKVGKHTLKLEPKFVEGKAAELELKAPKLKPSSKLSITSMAPGTSKVLVTKLSLNEAAQIAALTPNQIQGASPAKITEYFAIQAVTTAMAKPIDKIDTAVEVRTAREINAQYEQALATGLSTAVSTYTDTLTRTGVESKAATAAKTASKVAVDVALKTATAVKTKTAVVTTTKVKEAVRTSVRGAIAKIIRARPLPRRPVVRVKSVVGKPKVNPGSVSWDQGVVKIVITPPYREGTKDVHYKLLKDPAEGRGSPQRSLRTKKGEAPELIKLGMGVTNIRVEKGKKIGFDRRSNPRGPGILLPSGKMRRQKRRSVI